VSDVSNKIMEFHQCWKYHTKYERHTHTHTHMHRNRTPAADEMTHWQRCIVNYNYKYHFIVWPFDLFY